MAVVQGKTFTLKGLAPGATYVIEVQSIPKKGNPSKWSRPIKFNTNSKDVAPPNITDLDADFRGNTLVVTWNGSSARSEKDFKHFRIKVTSPNHPGITKNYFTDSDIFKFQEDQNRGTFGEYEKTISVTVYSVDRTGNESSGISITATAPTLDPVTNLQGSWDGRNLTASWEYQNPAVNFKSFDIQISNLEETITYYTSTIDTQISVGRNSFLGVFTSGIPSSLKFTVIVRNQLLASSDPSTIIIQETVLPAPTNATLTAAPLGYKVSWDAINDLGYQTTRIYESDSEDGTYNFVYTSYTSPVFVPSVNFTPRFIKIAHVNYNDTDSLLSATTPKSVIPINPNQIDTTPPGAVTNAAAAFDGSTYRLTFDKPADTDLLDFIITLTGTSPEGTSTRTTFLPVSENSQQIFQLTIDQNRDFFGSPKNNIVASIKARDLSSNIGQSVENISAAFVDNVPIPTNVIFTPGILSYTATWDDPEYGFYLNTRVYESSTENGTYTLTSYGKTPLIIFTNSSDSRWVKVSHVSTLGQESEKTSAVLVSPINPVSVDTTTPDQRADIVFTPISEGVRLDWTNPTGEDNDDIGGITVRYSLASEPTNYTWINIPFNSSSLLTTAVISNLLPNTTYEFSISTFDKTQNRTAYSTLTTVTTLPDSSPPPRPKAPIISAGSNASGPMTVRVIQESIEHNTTNPLPLDTSHFNIYMLDSGVSEGPEPGVATNDSASEVGSLSAGFYGSSNQTLLFIPLENGEQRYFYTRAVDTSGNVSDASPTSQSSAMEVFSDAYIDNLSANKILTGTLQADRSIKVGTTSNQITISSESGGTGKIYSGVGSYNSSDTGFYVDSSGLFSLKNRLYFDGTNLSIQGNITATGGSFSGNVQLNPGSLYAGLSPSSGERLILNSSGITGYNSSGSNKFTVTTEGRLTAKLGTIGGWTIDDTTLSATNVTIDSANKRISFGSSNQLIVGADVGGSGVGGIQIDANDYIYGSGDFSLANGNLSWNGATLSVTGSGSFSGEITANSGSITGPLSIGSGGYILIGSGISAGTPRVVINNSSIAGYVSNGLTPIGDATTFLLSPSGSSISGWTINTNSLEKTINGTTIKLDSLNGKITAGNSNNTVGIRSTSASGVAIWAGLENPDGEPPFRVTNSGDVYATKFNGLGIKLSGGNVPYSINGIATPLDYSILSLDGKDVILGATASGGSGPAKIRWVDGDNYQRATIGYEVASTNFPQNMVIRAAGPEGGNNGLMTIDAGSAGTVNIRSLNLRWNDAPIETPTSVQNRYRNLTDPNQGKVNNITYSPDNPVTVGGTTINGDLHFKY